MPPPQSEVSIVLQTLSEVTCSCLSKFVLVFVYQQIIEGKDQCCLCVRVELIFPHLDDTNDDHKVRGLPQTPQAPGFLNLEQQTFSMLLCQHFPDESLGTVLRHNPLSSQGTKLPDVPQALSGGGRQHPYSGGCGFPL